MTGFRRRSCEVVVLATSGSVAEGPSVQGFRQTSAQAPIKSHR
jgi:hypothetical protein